MLTDFQNSSKNFQISNASLQYFVKYKSQETILMWDAPLINAIVNNALFHPNSHHQSDATSNHLHPALFSILTVPDFVMKCIDIEVKAVP